MTEPWMLDLAGEAQRAAADKGERLGLDRQNFVRGGLAAVFLDRGVGDGAVRTDRGARAVAVCRDLGCNRSPSAPPSGR